MDKKKFGIKIVSTEVKGFPSVKILSADGEDMTSKLHARSVHFVCQPGSLPMAYVECFVGEIEVEAQGFLLDPAVTNPAVEAELLRQNRELEREVKRLRSRELQSQEFNRFEHLKSKKTGRPAKIVPKASVR